MSSNKNDPQPITDWDDAYANAAHITDSDEHITRWKENANQFRTEHRNAMSRLKYGSHERECIDVFTPAGNARGIAVFVHGGYWLRFSQSDWSHLAAGPFAQHYITAMIGYPLCPDVSIERITTSINAAVDQIANQIPNLPLFLAGHSAGGHLVSHLLCRPDGLANTTTARVKRVLSISGVHDLAPLTKTKMNTHLGLTLPDAVALSPARLRPRLSRPLLAWVGGAELPEFIRQNNLLENTWQPLGHECQTHIEPARHHFDVIDDLADPHSTMLERWLAE
jgi:acetyl esterase/lipase